MADNRTLLAQVTLLLSTVLGLTINHSTFICTRYNDPLTTSVAGSLKNIIMTLIGAVSFGDFKYAKWNVVGLGVSMAGAIWYATRAAIKVRPHSHGITSMPAFRIVICLLHVVTRSFVDGQCGVAQARKRGLAQQLLMRDPLKTGPLIGRDRLSALRATEAARNGTQPGSATQSTAASPSNNPSAPLVNKRVETV